MDTPNEKLEETASSPHKLARVIGGFKKNFSEYGYSVLIFAAKFSGTDKCSLGCLIMLKNCEEVQKLAMNNQNAPLDKIRRLAEVDQGEAGNHARGILEKMSDAKKSVNEEPSAPTNQIHGTMTASKSFHQAVDLAKYF